MIVVDRKLPRKGECPVLIADNRFQTGNIGIIKTDIVVSESDLLVRLGDPSTVFESPIMGDYQTMKNLYDQRYRINPYPIYASTQ